MTAYKWYEGSIADDLRADAAAIAVAADHVANSAAAAVTTGVTTPANVAYTRADQTALADAVLSCATAITALASKVNAILTALQAANLMDAS